MTKMGRTFTILVLMLFGHAQNILGDELIYAKEHASLATRVQMTMKCFILVEISVNGSSRSETGTITNHFYLIIASKERYAKNQAQTPECMVNSSIDEFLDDIFTNDQRLNGAILLHLLGAVYFFTVLAVVCNDYFLPSVECICKDLNISKDVAAATFMATGIVE